MALRAVRESDEAEIAQIDRDIARLAELREMVARHLELTIELIARNESEVAEEAKPAAPRPSPAAAGRIDPRAASRMRGERRRHMQEIVAASVTVIREAARPLTVAEIHELLPDPASVSSRDLQKALYKRVERKVLLRFDRGVFDLIDRRDPDGWVHPKDRGRGGA